jgi:hypothetical protein
MNTVAIEAKGISKRRESELFAKKKAKKEEVRLFKDRAEFDAALDESLNALREGRVYKVDMSNPEESIRKILRAVE